MTSVCWASCFAPFLVTVVSFAFLPLPPPPSAALIISLRSKVSSKLDGRSSEGSVKEEGDDGADSAVGGAV